ncbi:MAG: DAK2 domain-containing protein [Negativicutes bacterium]|nr:DAK2 domain-containing protein [Negativicutes bacterium]
MTKTGRRGYDELITAGDWRRMLQGAYLAFVREYHAIDRLNCRDGVKGDTGTNLLLTVMAAHRTAQATGQDDGLGVVCRRAADSARLAARGAAGKVLATMMDGLAAGLAGEDKATAAKMSRALQRAILAAYRASARPDEGAMVVISRAMARGARAALSRHWSLAEVLAAAIEVGEEEIGRWADAGRTGGWQDPGARGLLLFLRGCREGLLGASDSPEADFDLCLEPVDERGQPLTSGEILPYRLRLTVNGARLPAAAVTRQLLGLGREVMVNRNGDRLTVGLDTAAPGRVIDCALSWGIIGEVKIVSRADAGDG